MEVIGMSCISCYNLPDTYMPIVFKGMGGSIMDDLLYCAINEKCICICNHENEIVGYYKAPYYGIKFASVKEKIKVSHKTQMDVEEAARIGNGLGGLGGAVSAAANAERINSEGGLSVTQSERVNRLVLKTLHSNLTVSTLYLNGEVKRIPLYGSAEEFVKEVNILLGKN